MDSMLFDRVVIIIIVLEGMQKTVSNVTAHTKNVECQRPLKCMRICLLNIRRANFLHVLYKRKADFQRRTDTHEVRCWILASVLDSSSLKTPESTQDDRGGLGLYFACAEVA